MDIISDSELRNLFRIESAEHIQKLESGLLQLEKHPAESALIQEVFREAHSLKGSSRMLGLIEIQELASSIEDMLGEVRSGKLKITPDINKPVLETLDKIKNLVAQAVGDITPSSSPVPLENPKENSLKVLLDSSSIAVAPLNNADLQQGGQPELNKLSPALEVEKSIKASAAQVGQQLVKDFRIDTLRVDAGKLDFLLSQAGELVVSRSRIIRWQSEIDQLLNDIQSGNISKDELVKPIEAIRSRLVEDGSRLSVITEEIEAGIRNLRLLPISTLFDQFPRMVHDLAAEQKKMVELEIEGGSTVADKRIIEEMKAPLMHMLRNAIDHGIELPEDRIRAGKDATGKITIQVGQGPDQMRLIVRDDGHGLDYDAIRFQAIKRGIYSQSELKDIDEEQLKSLLLTPGFSTSKMITDISGRGVGLDVVRSAVEHMRGSLQFSSITGKGMTFILNLPVSLTSTRVMLFREWGESYALPCEHIHFVKNLKPEDLHTLEDRQCFYYDNEVITVSRLGLILGRNQPSQVTSDSSVICIVIKVGASFFGILVDDLQDEQEIVLKLPSTPIKRIRNISGVTILDSGLVCPVLNANDLQRSFYRLKKGVKAIPSTQILKKKKIILLVEDSIVTRVQEKRILEAAGYEVVTAVDGLEAWDKLSVQAFDAVVSDILMPNLTGLDLAARIRENRKFSELPIILVTSLSSEEDRRRGLEVGADAYLTKSEFDQTILLDAIARLT